MPGCMALKIGGLAPESCLAFESSPLVRYARASRTLLSGRPTAKRVPSLDLSYRKVPGKVSTAEVKERLSWSCAACLVYVNLAASTLHSSRPASTQVVAPWQERPPNTWQAVHRPSPCCVRQNAQTCETAARLSLAWLRTYLSFGLSSATELFYFLLPLI